MLSGHVHGDRNPLARCAPEKHVHCPPVTVLTTSHGRIHSSVLTGACPPVLFGSIAPDTVARGSCPHGSGPPPLGTNTPVVTCTTIHGKGHTLGTTIPSCLPVSSSSPSITSLRPPEPNGTRSVTLVVETPISAAVSRMPRKKIAVQK